MTLSIADSDLNGDLTVIYGDQKLPATKSRARDYFQVPIFVSNRDSFCVWGDSYFVPHQIAILIHIFPPVAPYVGSVNTPIYHLQSRRSGGEFVMSPLQTIKKLDRRRNQADEPQQGEKTNRQRFPPISLPLAIAATVLSPTLC